MTGKQYKDICYELVLLNFGVDFFISVLCSMYYR